ncbi:MAG: LarC family nickel insertion protein [Pseudomonadota bacterium]
MTRRVHLDPQGGAAGDMFVAALLDLDPAAERDCLDAVRRVLSADEVDVRTVAHHDGVLAGRRFHVALPGGDPAAETGHAPHRSWKDIRSMINGAGLPETVRAHAIGIFEALADAEGLCHGVDAADVTFHEVGAWDSIADVVAAAVLVDRFSDARWTLGPLPRGAGAVETAHGRMPVPAPATTRLLDGFVFIEDGLEGERVTPTGAAILAYLKPDQSPQRAPGRQNGVGIGFGERTFPGVCNILRAICYDDASPSANHFDTEEIVEVDFDIDDQSAEDLALALDKVRAIDGVIDVAQSAYIGKKGRMLTSVRILSAPGSLETLIAACFSETTTLGVRWSPRRRAVLRREHRTTPSGRRVKIAERAGGRTVKVEMDDLADAPDGHEGRERLRRAEERRYQRGDDAG